MRARASVLIGTLFEKVRHWDGICTVPLSHFFLLLPIPPPATTEPQTYLQLLPADTRSYIIELLGSDEVGVWLPSSVHGPARYVWNSLIPVNVPLITYLRTNDRHLNLQERIPERRHDDQ